MKRKSVNRYKVAFQKIQRYVLLMIVCGAVLSLSACLKEDQKVPKPNINSIVTSIDNIKKHQVYYSLKDSNIVASNAITDWDIRFDCNEHFNIWLNSARIMYAADAGAKTLNEVTDKAGLIFKFDYSTGTRDSNAIGEWGDFSLTNPSSNNHTYVLFLGQDENGDSLGFIKMQIHNFGSNTYTIEYKDLNDVSATSKTLNISKNNDYNYAYVSLKRDAVVNIEPKKTDYDLWFTLYTTYVYNFSDGLFYPYQVGGCLINPYNTEVAFDTTDRFLQIDMQEAQTKTYYKNWDIIGYGWKSFSGIGSGSGEYTIFTNVTYMVKTSADEYYKIRFMDYYNSARSSGYPKFETIQL